MGTEILLVMNVAETTTEEAIKQAVSAEEHGAHGIMILPPM